MQATNHRLQREARHFQWDRRLKPVATVRSGEVVTLETQDVSGGEISFGAPADVIRRVDRSRFYPLTGPVYVQEARAGDVLSIEVLECIPGSWGWTAIFPDRGLLKQDFPDPYIRYFELTGRSSADFGGGVRVPLAPFCGTIGLAPAEDGPIPVRPPHQGGGNIDTRQLTVGSTLYLPVLVDGGMFSVGDGHAAQGDGEVCLTGIECDMSITVRLTALSDRSLAPATFQVRAPGDPLRSQSTRIGSSASGPDLLENARNAVRGLIDWLEREQRMSRVDAYLLCSLAADLHISQLVNEPNFCVAAWMPSSIFQPEQFNG